MLANDLRRAGPLKHLVRLWNSPDSTLGPYCLFAGMSQNLIVLPTPPDARSVPSGLKAGQRTFCRVAVSAVVFKSQTLIVPSSHAAATRLRPLLNVTLDTPLVGPWRVARFWRVF